MTLCPYKWFLYIASVWAVIYLMLSAVPTSINDVKAAGHGQHGAANAIYVDDSDDDDDD